MMGIQEWIHKFEEGDGSRYIRLGAVALLLVALAAAFDMRQYRGFANQEAMDAAQLGRNIAEGKGYTTQFVRPLSLHLVQTHNADHDMRIMAHPDLANPPVYPLILAGLMRIMPFHYDLKPKAQFLVYQPESLIAGLNQALFLGVVVLAFLLARRLFDHSVAWLSAAVLVGTDIFWRFSVSGLPTILLMLILLGVIWCLVRLEQEAYPQPPEPDTPLGAETPVAPLPAPEPSKSPIWFIAVAALAGLLVGVGALTRYSFGWLIVPTLGYLALFFGPRRIVLCVAAALAFAMVLTPWLARNYAWSGHLFGTAGYAALQETSHFTGNRLERSLSPEFGQVEFDDYLRKFTVNLNDLVQNELPRFSGSLLAVLFWAGLLIPFRSSTLSRLRVFLLLAVGVLVVVQAEGRTHLSIESPVINSENLLVWLAPPVIVFGVAMFYILLEQIDLQEILRTWVIRLFWVVVSIPLLVSLLPPRAFPVPYPPYFPPIIQQCARWMKPNELMMSDMPWAVAWYGARNCVWLTLNVKDDFYALNDYGPKPIKGLYLTPLTTDGRLASQVWSGPDWAWGRFVLDCLVRTNLPPGFPLQSGPPGLLPDQLFLSDRLRWPSNRE